MTDVDQRRREEERRREVLLASRRSSIGRIGAVVRVISSRSANVRKKVGESPKVEKLETPTREEAPKASIEIEPTLEIKPEEEQPPPKLEPKQAPKTPERTPEKQLLPPEEDAADEPSLSPSEQAPLSRLGAAATVGLARLGEGACELAAAIAASPVADCATSLRDATANFLVPECADQTIVHARDACLFIAGTTFKFLCSATILIYGAALTTLALAFARIKDALGRQLWCLLGPLVTSDLFKALQACGASFLALVASCLIAFSSLTKVARASPTAVVAKCPACPRVDDVAGFEGLLQEAEKRLEVLEAAAAAETKSQEIPTAAEGKSTVASEVFEYNRELLEEVEALKSALNRTDETRRGEVGRTAWKRILPVERETLWKRLLAGFPYAAGSSSSRDALLFTKKGDGLESCEEVNVAVASNKPGVCLAIFDSRLPMYTMLRVDNTRGRLLEEERRKASPKRHVAAPPEAYSPEHLANRALVLSQADTLPKGYSLKESLEATGAFALEAPRLLKAVKHLISRKRLNRRNNTVVVMATNFGTLDLVANFICSCRSAGMEDALKSVLVFAADQQTQRYVDMLKVASFYDAGLGKLPQEAATTYGDHAFVRMMWLKVTAVYLVCATQHGVLFQDADVVWLRNPLDFFAQADPEVDTWWMDDGARSLRYSPLYANSGFYLLRANDRVVYFMHRLLLAYDNILAVRSHQHALIMLLLDTIAKYGLTANVLPPDIFPQGQIFHHKKALMQKIIDGTIPAYVFHMCWTAGRTDKLKYLKNMGAWFLQPTCSADALANNLSVTPKSCCTGLPAFQAPTPYVDKITIASKRRRRRRRRRR
ncbi:hypothetical protein CTAYLR_004437 [Chrysophaeum taylorii]|uniref:Nucleotide-diphospho-sugar transferase domain-containing protein n=1 Tax=Chrysophaeum taylorii TaxID=2483200 RepID=A0AAD7XKR9_9STRA|nr:hypothetical protein CTAYLR_004437 [Chrysophaeum taylorii]